MKPDFSGYATRANVLCSDGRTIASGAFKHQDGLTIPLVWEHSGKSMDNILGRAKLQELLLLVFLLWALKSDRPRWRINRRQLLLGKVYS